MTTAEAYVSAADARALANKMGLGYLNPDDPTGAWITSASDADLEAALRRGTSYVDGSYADRWQGSVAGQDQALAWPRVGVLKAYVPPVVPGAGAAYSLGPRGSWGLPGMGYGTSQLGALGGVLYGGYGGAYGGLGLPGATYLPSDAVPVQVVLACVHASLRELVAPGSLLPDYVRTQAVQTESVGPVSTTYFDRGPLSNSPVVPAVDVILRPLLTLVGGSSRTLYRS